MACGGTVRLAGYPRSGQDEKQEAVNNIAPIMQHCQLCLSGQRAAKMGKNPERPVTHHRDWKKIKDNDFGRTTADLAI